MECFIIPHFRDHYLRVGNPMERENVSSTTAPVIQWDSNPFEHQGPFYWKSFASALIRAVPFIFVDWERIQWLKLLSKVFAFKWVYFINYNSMYIMWKAFHTYASHIKISVYTKYLVHVWICLLLIITPGPGSSQDVEICWCGGKSLGSGTSQNWIWILVPCV